MRSNSPFSLKNRVKPALTAQREQASVNYTSPYNGTANGDRRVSTTRSMSQRMTINAYGYPVPEEVQQLKVNDASVEIVSIEFHYHEPFVPLSVKFCFHIFLCS